MAYKSGAPWYYAADGSLQQAINNGDGWEYPNAPMTEDGRDVRIENDPAIIKAETIRQLGYDPEALQVNQNGSGQVQILNPQTGQYEQAVAAGESGAAVPISIAQAQGLPIYQNLTAPKEGNQLADFGGTLAQLAATGLGSYYGGAGIDSLIGGLSGAGGGLSASVADAVAPSNVASYVAPEAAGSGLQVGNLPNWADLADMTVQNAGSGGLAAGGNVGGLGLTTGTGTGLSSLAELSAGGLGAGLTTGGLGLGGVAAGLTGAAAGAGGTAADYYAAQAADDAAAGANASGVAAPAGAGAAGNVYGTAAGTGTALSRIWDQLNGKGTASTADWTSVLGNVAGAGLGAYASNQQSGALDELRQRYEGYGAPSRARYEASMTPGFDPSTIPGYQGAVDNAMQAMLRKLSTQGNPFGNPGGLIEANKAVVAGTALPALQNYQGQNAASGGFGTYNAAAPGAAQASLGADNNFYNAIGGGIANLTNPRSSLEDLLSKFGNKNPFAMS